MFIARWVIDVRFGKRTNLLNELFNGMKRLETRWD